MSNCWTYSYKSCNTTTWPVHVVMTNLPSENIIASQASSSVCNSAQTVSHKSHFFQIGLRPNQCIPLSPARQFEVSGFWFGLFFFFQRRGGIEWTELHSLTQSEDWMRMKNFVTSSVLPQGRCLLKCYNRQLSLKSVKSLSPPFCLSFSPQLLCVVGMYSAVSGSLSKAREVMQLLLRMIF